MNRRFSKALHGSKVLLCGVAYKQDIDDCRESPAIRVYEHLVNEGAEVMCYDPYVKSFKSKGKIITVSQTLVVDQIEASDIVMVTTAHTKVDYGFICSHAKVVFDTKNVVKHVLDRGNIEVL